MDEEYASTRVVLKPCKTCGRSFNPDTLVKHMPICAKASKKKRKVFDSGRQRAAGSDVPLSSVIRPGKKPPKEDAKYVKAAQAKNNWRIKHENLIAGLRAARGAPNDGSGGSAYVPSQPDPTLEQCRFCGRRFAADRIDKHQDVCGKLTKKMEKDVGLKKKPPMLQSQTKPVAKKLPTPSTQKPVSNQKMTSTLHNAKSNIGDNRSIGSSGSSGRGSNFSSNRRDSGAKLVHKTEQPIGRSNPNQPATKLPAPVGKVKNFCNKCGNRFSGSTSRFCAECGAPR